MTKDDIIGLLIGIVRSSDNAPADEHTFEIVIEGLQLEDPAFYDAFYQKGIDEKNRLVPDCAVCKTPCGRTFNYDLNDLYEEADEDLKHAKLQLLNQLIEASKSVHSYSKELEDYFYNGLFAIGEYYDVSQFDDLKQRKEALGL